VPICFGYIEIAVCNGQAVGGMFPTTVVTWSPFGHRLDNRILAIAVASIAMKHIAFKVRDCFVSLHPLIAVPITNDIPGFVRDTS
jgi:hypothetical protein